MRFDQLSGRQRQPLVQRHVFESGRPEQFEKFRGTQWYIAGVLNIAAHRLPNEAYVASAEVEGSGGILRSEHRNSPRSGQIVLPFIRVGMPVNLPHGLRSDSHARRGDVGRDGEISCVGETNRSTRAFVGFLIRFLRFMLRRTAPCGLAIASLSIRPGTGASKMNSCSLGMRSKASSGTPKFADKTSFGMRANTSLRRKVLLSENEPSGTASRNSQPPGPRLWMRESAQSVGHLHPPADTGDHHIDLGHGRRSDRPPARQSAGSPTDCFCDIYRRLLHCPCCRSVHHGRKCEPTLQS
jgi:hypothetical protein